MPRQEHLLQASIHFCASGAICVTLERMEQAKKSSWFLFKEIEPIKN